MSDMIPLTAHAQKIIDDVTLQMATCPRILADVEMGGPREGGDRRCLLDAVDIRKLLGMAQSSPAKCVVLHHFGLRVQMYQEDPTVNEHGQKVPGHRWNNIRLLGAPSPAPAGAVIRQVVGTGVPSSGDVVPLSALSGRLVSRVPLQLPDRAEIMRDVDLGGADGLDRRLLISTAMLALFLAHAEESTTGRCVLHTFGLRVQDLRDQGGHTWTHCYLLGNLSPEVAQVQEFVGSGTFDRTAMRE